MHHLGSVGNPNNSTRPRKEKRLTYVLNDSDDTKHCAGINCLAVLKSESSDESDYLFTGSRDGKLKRWALSPDAATCSSTFESHLDWVTRLKCGGFIFALLFNHTTVDGAGIFHFMLAVTEIAKGAKQPSIQPTWNRELLRARVPPRVTFNHREYEQLTDVQSATEFSEQSFFFGPNEIATLRSSLPRDLDSASTTFEILTSYIWRCRTRALQLNPTEEIRMMCIVDARDKFNPPIPVGYYGNCFAFPAAVTTAGEITEKPLEFAVELIKKASGEVSEEYMHSVADLMVIEGRPLFTVVRSCLVLDTSYGRGFRNLDFGWGKAVYGGIAKPGAGSFPYVHFHVPGQNAKGEEGVFVLISLPTNIMTSFAKDLDDLNA